MYNVKCRNMFLHTYYFGILVMFVDNPTSDCCVALCLYHIQSPHMTGCECNMFVTCINDDNAYKLRYELCTSVNRCITSLVPCYSIDIDRAACYSCMYSFYCVAFGCIRHRVRACACQLRVCTCRMLQ
eukprot:Lankesteria_metandrocarpae@DN5371_c0_g1_i17.p1